MKSEKPRQARARVAKVLEADISAQVEECAALYGIALERQNTGVGSYANKDGSLRRVPYGKRGNPDRRGNLPDGRRLEVEIKRPGERPKPHQLARIRELNRSGAVAFWTDDVGCFRNAIVRLLEGWRVEIDDDGNPWVTDEPDPRRN